MLRKQTLLLVITGCVQTVLMTSDCIHGPSYFYSGKVNVTKSGLPCQRWDVNEPHNPAQRPSDGGAHNYCRNPDFDLYGLWCYTNVSRPKWEHCDVKKCQNDDLLLFSTRNDSGRNWISSFPADPEVAFVNQSGTIRSFYNSADNGYIWTLTADKSQEIVFFTDFRNNQLNVVSLRSGSMSAHMHGMCLGIEQLAYDWPTGNLYWTDSYHRWIMVTDQRFRYVAKIYKNQSEETHALGIHSVKRLLIFSYHVSRGNSGIKSCDLTGGNVNTLFSSPDATDVTTLTIDYNEDRLYWVNNLNAITEIVSSDLDGRNFRLIYRKQAGKFWGIAVYQDTLFLADQVPYEYGHAGEFHKILIMTKNGQTRNSYKSRNKSKNLWTYATFDRYHNRSAAAGNPCPPTNPCDHICVPADGGNRKCLCQIGYVTSGDTRCLVDILEDNFVLINDATMQTIYQFPLGEATDDYARLPIPADFDGTVTALAVDGKRKALYWSNANTSAIYRSSLNGRNAKVFIDQYIANNMKVDPQTGNLYFTDPHTGGILVADPTGTNIKSVFLPNRTQEGESLDDEFLFINEMEIDHVNGYIYWTAISIASGFDAELPLGALKRMGLDGSNVQIIIGNLFSPKALAISYDRQSLFISTNGHLVYEILLSQLGSTNERLPSNRIRHLIPGANPNDPIREMQYSGGFLYFVGETGISTKRFRLGDGAAENVGSSDFFWSRFLTIYNSTYENLYDGFPIDCRDLSCTQLCLRVPGGSSVCQCSDGYKFASQSSSRCVHEAVDEDAFYQEPYCGEPTGLPYVYSSPDRAPTYLSCPQDMAVSYLYCQRNGIPLPHWDDPVWIDDVTESDEQQIKDIRSKTWKQRQLLSEYGLVLCIPLLPLPRYRRIKIKNIPKTTLKLSFIQDASQLFLIPPSIRSFYTAGIYTFLYRAVDLAGNVGRCSFKVTVTQKLCPHNFPPPNSSFTVTPPICDNGTITQPITCKDENLWVSYGMWSNKTFPNICLPNLEWMIPDYSYLTCRPRPTSSPSYTTTAPPTPASTVTTPVPSVNTDTSTSSLWWTSPRSSSTTGKYPDNKASPSAHTTTNPSLFDDLKSDDIDSNNSSSKILEKPESRSSPKGPSSSNFSGPQVIAPVVVVLIVVLVIVVVIFIIRRKRLTSSIPSNPIAMIWQSRRQPTTNSHEPYQQFR